MEFIFLIVFIVVILFWIIRFKNLFSINDKKKYEESRDDLIDDLLEISEVVINFLPYLLQQRRLRHPKTATHKSLSGFAMKIIPGQNRLLTPAVDIATNIGLIRRLVFRKPYIPVDPEHAILRQQSTYGWFFFPKLMNYFLQKSRKIGFRGLIGLPVLIKPFFTIILFQ